MNKLKQLTLKAYLEELSKKTPAPGGGSAAALTAALGAALISMVVNYSLGKGRPPAVERKLRQTLRESERLRRRLLELVDLDAQAYLGLVAARKGTAAQQARARKRAREVPLEICRRCYESVGLTPLLVREGNRYLLSDVRVAVELLLAAFYSARINVDINQ